MKNLIFVGLVALSGALGCDSNNNNNNNNNNPDLSVVSNPDLLPTCFTGTPATDEQFLNACSTASSGVEITPFYPDNAPNGVLPPLN